MRTVLVVEDEWLIGQDLKEHLEALGAAEVHVAITCVAALEVIRKDRPDVAFVDTYLGSETCEEVLDECDRQGIPVVVATAHSPALMPSFALNRPVIGKPFDRRNVELVLWSVKRRLSVYS